MPIRPRILRGLVALVLVGALLGGVVARAHAGTWTLVSCTQPNGQPAPTDGWATGVWAGSVSSNSGDTNTCEDAGGALTAESSAAGVAASYTGPEWVFTAPAGMTIAGGSITASLTSPQGQAWIGTPGSTYDGADVIVNCQLNAPCGADGTDAGTFAIDHPGGTMIYAPALCVDFSSPDCPQTSDAANAAVSITQALIELSSSDVPTGTDFTGTLLAHDASGVADLVYLASDPGATGGYGPGVYGVTVQIDGATVYSGVPDTNGGACTALGSDGAGGLEFDSTQPCAATASITVPVDTRALSDGRHQLTVIESDAAGDQATVLDRYITTSNPHTTPRPRVGEVATRLVVHYVYRGSVSHITVSRALHLPRGGTVTVACRGAHCPTLSPRRVSTRDAAALFARLRRTAFRAGQRLELEFRQAGRRPERIEFRFRAGASPVARLLR